MKKILCLCLSLLLAAMFVCAAAEGERMSAEQYTFELTAEEPLYIENMIFSEPVTVSGDYGQIFFINCEFASDIILTANEFTRVFIMPDCTVEGSCIIKNNVKEATLEYAFPKFLTFAPVPVVLEDCIGAVIVLGTFDIQFAGETYQLTDAELFYDNTKTEPGFVPYEGQEANCYVVCQWFENGEKKMLVECEYDPEM